jgi:hypothetical protein
MIFIEAGWKARRLAVHNIFWWSEAEKNPNKRSLVGHSSMNYPYTHTNMDTHKK